MRRTLTSLFAALSLSALLATAGLGAIAAGATSAPVLPTVKGAFGAAPRLSFPSSHAPSSFEAKALHQGNGQVVKKGDLLVANYFGQIWGGKVFTSSFGQGIQGFPIGVGQVIPGWDKGLVGAKVGSRMLLVLPPAEGYGPSGQSAAGITGTSTLVFVVDVLHVYAKTVAGQKNAAVQHSTVGGVTVHGKLGSAPTITITKGAAQPSKVTATVIAKGTGPKAKAGLIVLQYVAVNWTGAAAGSTWQIGTPDAQPIGVASAPNPLDVLVGIPIGSRVLVQLPKTAATSTSAAQPAYAVSFDLVAQPGSSPS